ncbi:MAG: methylenetetrahydrofolate dehydrogenase (NADP+) / methenyltetrahydrofolate cyclohydrolase [Erysipelotrichaceae bacterium]|nr:MAG: methylenetetrahydrofolate dehydrogenase (NADP+) / methenyltetrahydrofolate [Erysipelotrichaceae bacterium]TXT19962.1 MAG: methylenetetrahydrofolate dehydrogenase (NADP+) / methenyltetrahydrofolate cyclohydrolase [Erysipelotrichaceae bacterium]
MSILLDGKQCALDIENLLKSQIDLINVANQRLPKLVVILVGTNPASLSYVTNKAKACNRVGFLSEIIQLPEDSTLESVIEEVEKLNHDDQVDGILVQLPLPKGLDAKAVIEAIDPNKDVDGLHSVNVTKLVMNEKGFVPCTAKGVVTLLKTYNIPLQGAHAVVLGRSQLVGRPLAQLLSNENCTVTICHSKTVDMPKHTRMADIVIAAIGRPKMITRDYLSEKTVVVDVGINKVDDKLVGDVDFENVVDLVKAISPVPKGVGPMTIVTLLQNTIDAYHLRNGN